MRRTAVGVSEYIISRCSHRNKPISNLKLQGMLYFIQAEFLVALGYPCFDDGIEAWNFGVAVPKVYDKYSAYGGASIPDSEGCRDCPFSSKEKEVADVIIDELTKFSAAELAAIIRKQKPWVEAHSVGTGSAITNASLIDFFE